MWMVPAIAIGMSSLLFNSDKTFNVFPIQYVMNKEPRANDTSEEHSCHHYKRSSCLLHFPCCDQGTFFPCHKCHNEFIVKQTSHQELGEDEMEVEEERCHPQATCFDARSIQCTACSFTSDEFVPTCKNNSCNTSFASYFCDKCKLFVNDKDLDPYHCDGCGICRVYKSKNFHCSKCNICLEKKMKNNHKCLENSGHDLCSVCMEGVFSGCIVLPCSHKLHRSCLEGLIQHRRLACPNCRQSFVPNSDNSNGSFSLSNFTGFFSRILCRASRQSNST